MTSKVSLRASIYTRFSHADGDSDSCAVQEQMARQAIEAEGWTLTKAHADDGISGREMVKRPGLHRVRESAKAGEFCATDSSGMRGCGYVSLAQCQATQAGKNGTCDRDPFYKDPKQALAYQPKHAHKVVKH